MEKNWPINLMELRATYKTGGGPDKTILLSAEMHNRKIVNPIVVYLRDKSDKDFQIGNMSKGRGFKYIEVLDRNKLDIRCIMELYKITKKYKIDIVHGHDYKTDPIAYILKILNPKIKILSTAHGWITNTRQTSIYKWIHLKFLKRFQNIIAVSKATKDLMVRSGINEERIELLYNGVDENYWDRRNITDDLKRELSIPDDSLVIGSVGRLGEEKDYFSFLEVAKRVHERIAKTCFVIVGDGKESEKQDLLQYSKKIGVDKYVIFTGYRNDLLRIYNTFNVFLSTSLTEGLPNTMLEAMAMKVPIVATDVGGVSELVDDGISGFLYSVRDVKGISEKIIEIIKNDNLRNKLSIEARRRIETSFSFNRRTERIEAIYKKIACI